MWQANIELIRRSYSNISNLLPLHGALGSQRRTVTMKGAGSRAGNSAQLSNVFKQPSVDATANKDRRDTFEVFTLDELFSNEWTGERLAFGHFDVEGSEADVLRGASAILRRGMQSLGLKPETSRSPLYLLLTFGPHTDRPTFVVEVHVLQAAATKELMDLIMALDYQPFIVAERPGMSYPHAAT